MTPIYKFFLAIGTSPAAEVHPIYNGEVAMEFEKQSGQQFFRRKFSGKLAFAGPDFTAINGAAFDTRFGVQIWISYNGGRSFGPYWQGHFYKTDCEFDADAGRVSVTPSADDKYDAVLAGLDKEFDLLKLAPAIQQVKADKRAMIQVYVPGETTVGCFLSGIWWEQECDAVTNTSKLTATGNGKMNFGLLAAQRIVETSSVTSPQVPQVFNGLVGNENLYTLTRGVWEFSYFYSGGSYPQETFTIRNTSSGERWSLVYNNQPPHTPPTTVTLLPVSGTGASGNVTIYLHTIAAYGRVVCDVPSISGSATYTISGTDAFITDNRNYSRVQKLAQDANLLAIYDELSATPTEWGQYEDGRYYMFPASQPAAQPIGRSAWSRVSVWFVPTTLPGTLEVNSRAQFTIRDAYPLWSVIEVLLGQIAPGITHKGTIPYSNFLYGENLLGIEQMLAITPKSNIINAQYDQPAQKAPITLGRVMDMLAKCFRCYWFIDDYDRFRIEHIDWFRNGGGYGISPSVGIDLTAQAVSRNGKAWATGRNQYTFDKPDMAARYQFGWMDDVTLPFEGLPIDIVSGYVEPGNIEQVQVADFTSDIDYILLNPSEISPDGFVLLAAVEDGDEYVLPYRSFSLAGTSYNVQNGLVAFAFLVSYYAWDMPASEYKINGVVYTAQGVKRLRVQQLKFPCLRDPDTNKLVKTEIGDGNIEKLSINLSSRTATATLHYDTE